MHEPDFWTCCAESMEMSIEGNRLIAAEIAWGFQTLWRRIGRWLGSIASVARVPNRHLPPV